MIRVFLDAAAAHVLQFQNPSQLFPVDAFGIMNDAIGIRNRNYLGA